MQRLEGLDTSFVYLEHDASPMHVAMTCVFDPSTAPDGYSFAGLRERVEERLPRLAPFRRRLVEMPARMHRPVWVDDPQFDLDAHVHRTTLPARAGVRELERFSADVIAHPLDRSRPLWEMHVLEGLEDGNVGVVTKVHHAAIDGISGAELTVNLLDAAPEADPDAAAESPWQPPPLPSPLSLARGAARDLLRQPGAIARSMVRSAAAGLRLLRHNRRTGATPPPGPFAAPRTPCNGVITPRRHAGFTEVALDEVTAVKDAAGVTVNDVILAMCSRAVRSHLDDYGGCPPEPLVAAVPISVRTDEDRGAMGNRLSAMLVDLATTIDDPVARLEAIAAGTRVAKEQARVLGPDTVSELAALTPPAVLAAMGNLDARLDVTARIPPVCNLIVSNFPGPTVPLYFTGMRMLTAYPIGPLGLGTGLNITVQSYLDTLWFGIVSCPDMLPDPAALPGRIGDALRDLTKAVGTTA
jgi:diacylglycerol O-acyltransferase